MRIFRLLFWLWFLGAAIMVLVTVGSTLAGRAVPENSILHVKLSGPLPERAQDPLQILLDEEQVGMFELGLAIRRAAEDEKIVGLLLDVRSPELSFAQIEELAAAVEKYTDSGKWSLAYLETGGEMSRGNGAYACALMADHIILTPPAELNLVGLQATSPFLKGLFEKIELPLHVEKRHEFKNAPNIFTHDKFNEPHRKAMGTLVGNIEQALLELIAHRRKVTPQEAEAWVRQGPYSASEALENKMVDQLAYWDEAVQQAKATAGRKESHISPRMYLQFSSSGADREDNLGLIFASGTIMRGESSDGAFGDSPIAGSSTLTQAFEEAIHDGVKAIVLRVDSPGGSYVASDLIRRSVERAKESRIPVVVSMGSVAASGGYFVAMESDHILALPSTITGSIGVYSGKPAIRHMMNRWFGITFDTHKQSDNAVIFDQLDLPGEQQQKYFTNTLDRIYEDFVSKAAAGRDMTPEQMHKLAKGRVWSGKEAQKRGLVDSLGGLDDAIQKAKELANLPTDESVTLLTFPKAPSPLKTIKRLLAGGLKIGEASVSLTRALQTEAQLKAHIPSVR